jgi:aryl-alcohol dehydrogenase-like predicted oxidoreductase
MKIRRLGHSDIDVGAVGLGCMVMAGDYGPVGEADAIATMHRALDIGVNLFDTANVYGKGSNETLVGKGLNGHRDKCVLATKFGSVHKPDGTRGLNAKAIYVPQACDESLQRLGIDHIDLYYLHRPDPEVEIEETVGAMARLIEAGKIRHIGLSEVSVETLRRAHAVHPISALQSEYSLFTRDHEQTTIPVCKELGITFIPYAPLGRAMLADTILGPKSLGDGDKRLQFPRFSEDNLERNQKLLTPLKDIAARHGCTPAQISLAWILSRNDNFIPIPGTRRIAHVEANSAATDIALDNADIRKLDNIYAPGIAAGPRMSEWRMARSGL